MELRGLVLADEIQGAIDAIAPLARLKNLDFQVQLPADDLRVLANSEHLERILVNLLDNAVKYSPSDARVTVWTEVDGKRIWTHVRDHGVGIPMDEQERVFERFYRTQGARGSRERGSGLGLAIVKHIVQQLGGEIHVTSEPGRGSDFFFALRMPPVENEPTVPNTTTQNGVASGSEIEILPGIGVPG
jgi:signal transduction histidine kinase